MNTTTTSKKSGLNIGRLSSVAQMAVQKHEHTPVVLIDLALIYATEQVRTTFPFIEELAESLKDIGIKVPLILHAENDGRYRIIAGERRFRAAKLAGFIKVPAYIERNQTEEQIRVIQIAENKERAALTAYDQSMGVINDIELYGIKNTMRLWNCSEAWISKRVSAKRYAEPVMELLKSGKCGDFEVLISLNQIFGLDETEFYRLNHSLNTGEPLSRETVRDTLTKLKMWKQEKEAKEAAEKRSGAETADKSRQEAIAITSDESVKIDDDVTAANHESRPLAENRGESANDTSIKQRDVPSKRAKAENRLGILRNGFFQLAVRNKSAIQEVKEHLTTLDHDSHSSEWVMWQAFKTSVLPLLDGIGQERANLYLKQLQRELKNKTPAQLWDALHPEIEGEGRNPNPDMPQDWRF